MIYLFDLDGTLSFNGRIIERPIIEALKKLEAKGNQGVFASARPIRDMIPLLGDFPSHFLIGGNGSIVRKSGKIEVVSRIPEQSVKFIENWTDENDLDYLIDSDWNYALRNRNDQLAQINNKVDANHLAANVSPSQLKEVIKINLLNLGTDLYSTILEKLKNYPLSLVNHQGSQSIDITAQGINKYTSFRKYFPDTNYIAFGNDENDIELLKHTSQAFVVGSNQNITGYGLKVKPTSESLVEQIESLILKS